MYMYDIANDHYRSDFENHLRTSSAKIHILKMGGMPNTGIPGMSDRVGSSLHGG